MSLVGIGQIELETVTHGDPGAPAILLIQGLGTPLTRWPAALIAHLTGAGFRVIVFDNRDIGLSTKMDVLGLPDIKRLMNNVRTFAAPAPRLPAMPIPYMSRSA
jgi:pimeloyl-ACP methyl ester carboxylesterase